MARTGWRVAAAGLACGAVLLGGGPARASLITLTLAAGLAGNATPTATNTATVDTGTGNWDVALNQLTADGIHTAKTAGGTVFFGGSGLPLLINLSDGRAYLASAGSPDDAPKAVAGNAPLASATPVGGASELPSAATLLGLTVSDPGSNGDKVVSVGATDAAGRSIGGTLVTMPGDGWWVLGLSPAATTPTPNPTPDPDPTPTPEPGTGGNGGGETPGGTPVPVPVPPAHATPEPSTMALAALGMGAAGLWRRRRS